MATPILAHPSNPAAEPITPILIGALRPKLDAAHLALERIDDMLEVAAEVLRNQSSGIDLSAVTVIENTVTAELTPAKDRIVEALELLQEAANG